jgi:tRNA (adenine22-N1)-methyltransferase
MTVKKGYNRKISERIKAICKYVEDGKTVFDLCCDHGLIGFFAHQKRNVPKVIFVDQVKHITDALALKIAKHASNEPFEVRCSPAEDIELPEEPVTIIAAGVYAATIYNIITNIPSRRADTYILSPNSDLEDFEQTITNMGITVLEKTSVTENQRNYQIYKAHPSKH